MWEPFTPKARHSIVLAQEESQRLGNNYIGTEHLLLGIISSASKEEERVWFDNAKISLQRVRDEVEAIVGKGSQTTQQEMTFTPRAKRAIEMAFEAARQTKCNYIAPEHLLLGLLWEGQGVAARVLTNLMVDVKVFEEDVRSALEHGNLVSQATQEAPPLENLREKVIERKFLDKNILKKARLYIFVEDMVKAINEEDYSYLRLLAMRVIEDLNK